MHSSLPPCRMALVDGSCLGEWYQDFSRMEQQLEAIGSVRWANHDFYLFFDGRPGELNEKSSLSIGREILGCVPAPDLLQISQRDFSERLVTSIFFLRESLIAPLWPIDLWQQWYDLILALPEAAGWSAVGWAVKISQEIFTAEAGMAEFMVFFVVGRDS